MSLFDCVIRGHTHTFTYKIHKGKLAEFKKCTICQTETLHRYFKPERTPSGELRLKRGKAKWKTQLLKT